METSILIYHVVSIRAQGVGNSAKPLALPHLHRDGISRWVPHLCALLACLTKVKWEACNEFAGTEPRRSLALVTVWSNFQASKYFCQHCTGTYHMCVTKLCVRSSNTACLEGEGVQAPYSGVKFKCEWTSSLAESHVSCAPAGSC